MPTAFKNLSETLTDSFSPAVILPEAIARVYYSELRKWTVKIGSIEPFSSCRRGDTVCMALPNCLEFILVFFWAMHHGIVMCPIDPELETVNQAHRIKMVDPALVVVDVNSKLPETLKHYSYVTIKAVLQFQPHLKERIQLLLPTKPRKATRPATITINVTMKGNRKPLKETSDKRPTSDHAVLIWTHGTTQESRLVPLSHRNILHSIENFAEALHIDVFARTLLTMPLHHAHGLIGVLLPTIFTGGAVVLPYRFSTSSILPAIIRWRITWYSTVPSNYKSILDSKRTFNVKESKLKFVQSCGSHLPQATLFGLEKFFGVPVITTYAMTEACWAITTNTPYGIRSPGSVGTPCGLKVQIFKEDSIETASGFGEVCISGKSVFENYAYNNTARFFTLDNESWFRTGDVGYFNELNSLVLSGRLLEVVVLNDKKVYLHLLEQVYKTKKGVDEACLY